MLPNEAIREFQELYKQHFGEWLEEKEARRKADNLLRLFRAVYGTPMSGKLNRGLSKKPTNLPRSETESTLKETEERF